MTSITLEDLPNYKGKVVGQSPWKNISQEMIQAFADATGDHQWIHVDVERAKKEAPWGAPVAHGFLTLSLIPQLNQQAMTVTGPAATINYGMNKVRFVNPVPTGSRVRATASTVAVAIKGNAVDQTRAMTVEIEGVDKPALVAEWIGRTVFA